MEIYPSILVSNEDDFIRKVEAVRPLNLRVHVDVMDGNFVPNRTWADPAIVEEITEDMPFNVHLMVANPEHAVPLWSGTAAEQIFFHFEATHRHKLILRATKQKEKMGIAINPGTPVPEIGHLLDLVSGVLIMSVVPGKGGQRFNELALDKIRELKRLRPNLHVTVDGGIKPHNIAAVAAAGADAVVVGSALTGAEYPELALQKLQKQLASKSA